MVVNTLTVCLGVFMATFQIAFAIAAVFFGYRGQGGWWFDGLRWMSWPCDGEQPDEDLRVAA